MESISRSSKVPLYYQLYEILLARIKEGDWQPDDLLPSEAELVEQYDLSRATVRQAFDMLVNQGYVYRRRGQGTFVARPTIEQNLSRIVSFWEDRCYRARSSLQARTSQKNWMYRLGKIWPVLCACAWQMANQ